MIKEKQTKNENEEEQEYSYRITSQSRAGMNSCIHICVLPFRLFDASNILVLKKNN